jgi:hypothetical protein
MKSFEERMYNYEVNPPAKLWDRIAVDLDEAGLENSFPSKLYETTIEPPPTAWNRISSALEEPELTEAFAARLYNVEATPPPGIWDRIRALLETEMVGSQKKGGVTSFWKYAAAAVLIGAVAFTVLRFASDRSDTPPVSAVNVTPDSAKPKTAVEAPAVSMAAVGNIPGDDQLPDAHKNLVAKLETPAQHLHKVAVARETATRQSSFVEDPALTNSIYAYEYHVPPVADRYVMLMTPEGNIIRLSKKWGELVCCVSGAEQDQDCKDQIKKWQQKIASSPIAPSPGNFMDILGLVNSISEPSEL